MQYRNPNPIKTKHCEPTTLNKTKVLASGGQENGGMFN